MKNFLFLVAGIFVLNIGFVQAETIKVGTIERPPFMMHGEEETLTGFAVDLISAIASRAGLEVEYQEFDVFSDMIGSTERGELDMSAANISVTAAREKTMDYSQPIFDGGLQVLIPAKSAQKPIWKIIWESGIFYFLGFAVFILLIIAHLLWWFERGREGQRHDYFRDSYLSGVWDAFWWAFIVMTMGGFENEVPHTIRSRVLAIIWIVASLFFISTLTAKITTSLTVAELQSDINSYRDLVGKKVGVPAGPTAKNFLSELGIQSKQYSDLDSLFADLENQTLDAVVHDAPIVGYYATHKGRGKVQLVGELFKPDKYAILFPEDSIYREQFDQILAEMREDGSYSLLTKSYFGN